MTENFGLNEITNKKEDGEINEAHLKIENISWSLEFSY